MPKDLLLEIGTEDIPAHFIEPALKQLEELARKALLDAGIDCKDIMAYGTPRRLALYVSEVSERRQDRSYEILGPSVKVAFEEGGKPTKAAVGFAKRQGVKVEDLVTRKTSTGECICALKLEKGSETLQLLPQILPKIIKDINFSKSMCWEPSRFRFVRPIRWLLALFGESVVNFELAGVRTGRQTYGHRFLTQETLKVPTASEYQKILLDAKVIVVQAERRKLIERQAAKLSEARGGQVLMNPELLGEITNLVECPTALVGEFKGDYLNLPHEVLTYVICRQQKYFPVVDSGGKPLPHFVNIRDGGKEGMDIVRQGNERVIDAKLADAQFFFDQDRARPLADRIEELKGVSFQERLWSVYEKVQRMIVLSGELAKELCPELEEVVKRASRLCKADLVSAMVTEFPTLQGVMGKVYASLSGENKEVAQAIQEHYLPRGASDDLPQSVVGSIVGMADRIDTLVGFFGIGLIPTGSQDPYGLRRQAQGVIQIILGKCLNISLSRMIETSLASFKESIRLSITTKEDLLDFFKARMAFLLESEGVDYDIIEAALAIPLDDLLAAHKRATTLNRLRPTQEFGLVVIAYGRAANILPAPSIRDKKVGRGFAKGEAFSEEDPGSSVQSSLLKEPAEIALHQAYLSIQGDLNDMVSRQEYDPALKLLAKLGGPIDNFFDRVLVMTADRELKSNRMAILNNIVNLFRKLADFSKVVTE